MAKYSDKFVASAIAALQSNGYPDDQFALERTAKYLKLPGRTLRRWAAGENRPNVQALVVQEKRALADVYEDVTYQLLEHASNQDIVDQMTGKDAIMAAAIATDKMRLLQGLPTEIIVIVPQLIEALRLMGLDPMDTFNRMIARAHEQAER